jgi:hypothetical protein
VSDSPPPPTDAFRLWLLLAAVIAAAAGILAASRIKPPVLFAAGLGLVLGLALRFLAEGLAVPRTRRVVAATMVIAAAAFATSFGLSYWREARAWDRAHQVGPENPLAAALLNSFPDTDADGLAQAPQRFTFFDYLDRRLPQWAQPWPEVLFAAEAVACVVIAGMCVFRTARRDPGVTP